MVKRIVLCADDYGQASSISSGIIDLINQKRLSATSCMVNQQGWGEQGKLLVPYEGQIDIGLHFNLTEGKPLSLIFQKKYGATFFSLPVLMFRAALGQLDQAVITAECKAQIQRFSEITGFLPNFIDGHQHIQQFPVIRDAIVAAHRSLLAHSQGYVRVSEEPIEKFANVLLSIKKILIAKMGAKQLRQVLMQSNIKYNQSFAGIYRFNKMNVRRSFQGFLQNITEGGVIMCHPGLRPIDKSDDPIAAARFAEYQYLTSSAFKDDCETFNIKLSRLS